MNNSENYKIQYAIAKRQLREAVEEYKPAFKEYSAKKRELNQMVIDSCTDTNLSDIKYAKKIIALEKEVSKARILHQSALTKLKSAMQAKKEAEKAYYSVLAKIEVPKESEIKTESPEESGFQPE